MKLFGTLISLIILFSCQSKTQNTNGSEQIESTKINRSKYSKEITYLDKYQIDSLTGELDLLVEQHILKKYPYPNMSLCGGRLDGYFKDSTLFVIDAIYQAELGYLSHKMYWYKNDLIKIVYHEHYAEWEKYKEDYPSDKFEWAPNKMTYTDTIYYITLGKECLLQKVADGKVISENPDTALLNKLIDCGFTMKNELEIEINLEK